MALTGVVVENIIRKLIAGEDYRIEVVALIDAQFLQYVVDFFTRVFQAKIKDETITLDWYKRELLNPNLSKEEIAIHSGLNMKTIGNMYQTTTKEVVLNASFEHYDTLAKIIEELTEQNAIDVTLTIKFNKASVELNISESLVVINTIAVKRAALRGGLWGTAGKQVEKPLMMTLCKLFKVPSKHFDQKQLPKSLREVDYYLIKDDEYNRCEVKLMGKGNPESADAVIARDSRVFVADKLSNTNKKQLDGLGVEWVELRDANGFKRFERVLSALEIPHKPFKGNLKKELDKIFASVSDKTIEELATEIVNPLEEA